MFQNHSTAARWRHHWICGGFDCGCFFCSNCHGGTGYCCMIHKTFNLASNIISNHYATHCCGIWIWDIVAFWDNAGAFESVASNPDLNNQYCLNRLFHYCLRICKPHRLCRHWRNHRIIELFRQTGVFENHPLTEVCTGQISNCFICDCRRRHRWW
jgi:hypothetical protein